MQPSDNEEQLFVNSNIIKLYKKLNIPYIITNDGHYLKKEDAAIHKAFLNSQDGDREVDSFYATTYLMGTEELETYMNLPEEELNYEYTKGRTSDVYKNLIDGNADVIFAAEPSQNDLDYAKSKGATIVKVVRYGVGEGIQKKEENFAEEVAKQMK